MAKPRTHAAAAFTTGAARARAEAEQQIVDTIATLASELPAAAQRPLGVLLAALFAALPGAQVPAALREAAQALDAARSDPAARRAFFALASRFWRFLRERGALDADRAGAFAAHLGPCAEHPALLFFHEQEAAAHGLRVAAARFAAELDERFPGFRCARARAHFDAGLLEALGLAASTPGLDLQLDASGHLAYVSVRAPGGPTLTLEACGGGGRFEHTGTRGGSGFCVDERYADGRVHATFFSPWHDGEESSEPLEWVCWVLSCLGTVAAEAARVRAPRPRRRR